MTETGHRLVLLRHAKAEMANGGDDALRTLALRGRNQASAVGMSLLSHRLEPEIVLCSPALRTRQTAELALRNMGNMPEVELRFVDGLYRGFVSEVIEEVRELDARVRTVLVVGHEPTMSAAAAMLASPDDSDPGLLAKVNRGVSTATYTVLEQAGPWSELGPGTARLVGVVAPARPGQ